MMHFQNIAGSGLLIFGRILASRLMSEMVEALPFQYFPCLGGFVFSRLCQPHKMNWRMFSIYVFSLII